MYLKCTNLMSMLFHHEWKSYPSDVVVGMIDNKKSYVRFLSTLKIEGVVDINFR